MMKRSKAEERRIIKRAEFLRNLLSEFGASLHGFDPGVTAGLKNVGCENPWGGPLDFSLVEWSWLEPLLLELKAFRESRAEPFWKGITLNGEPLHPGKRFKIGDTEYEFKPV